MGFFSKMIKNLSMSKSTRRRSSRKVKKSVKRSKTMMKGSSKKIKRTRSNRRRTSSKK